MGTYIYMMYIYDGVQKRKYEMRSINSAVKSGLGAVLHCFNVKQARKLQWSVHDCVIPAMHLEQNVYLTSVLSLFCVAYLAGAEIDTL